MPGHRRGTAKSLTCGHKTEAARAAIRKKESLARGEAEFGGWGNLGPAGETQVHEALTGVSGFGSARSGCHVWTTPGPGVSPRLKFEAIAMVPADGIRNQPAFGLL